MNSARLNSQSHQIILSNNDLTMSHHMTHVQGNRVAVKVLSLDALGSRIKKNLYQEALIMCQLYHPCITRVYGFVDDGGPIKAGMPGASAGHMVCSSVS